MFRISRKADYAVLIMCQLALREEELNGDLPADESVPPISAQETAGNGQLSKSLTANLMKAMTRHGLLESVRGVSGGYRLARKPEDITLAQILTAVEGPLALVECASHLTTSTQDENCALTHCCPSRRAMRVVHQRIAHLFDNLTLAELIEIDSRSSELVSLGRSKP
jgi:Rrf2 family cysteine metabolism transcriptional repressor